MNGKHKNHWKLFEKFEKLCDKWSSKRREKARKGLENDEDRNRLWKMER